MLNRARQNLCPGQVEIWFGRVNFWHDLSGKPAHFSLPANNKTTENYHKPLAKYKFIHSWRNEGSNVTKEGWTVQQISTLWSHAFFLDVTSMKCLVTWAIRIYLSPKPPRLNRAHFIQVFIVSLLLVKTFWTSSFGLRTTNSFLMIARRTSESKLLSQPVKFHLDHLIFSFSLTWDEVFNIFYDYQQN